MLCGPMALPIGAHQGISTLQPASSEPFGNHEIIRGVGKDFEPSSERMRAASTSPKTSGCSVSWWPITSSFSQLVPKTSRAILAVSTASYTDVAAGGVRQHVHAERPDQLEEGAALAASGGFAPAARP